MESNAMTLQYGCARTPKEGALVPWLETIIITGGIPGIGYLASPIDPFLLETSFPWVILAPILIGSRYGFSYGFGSALGLVAGLSASWYLELFPMSSFPTVLGVGLLLTGMVTGEFRDYWARRVHRLDAKCAHQQSRLDEFSRVYQLLKISHDRLEQQVAGSSVSLRTSLLAFRKHMSTPDYQDSSAPLHGMGERILSLFSEYGSVQMAALYQANGAHGIDLIPVARLGKPPSLSAPNRLVQEALETGHTVSVGADDAPTTDSVLAAVPLVDVHGKTWGVVTVNELPFVDFHHRTLDLLTILGGHIGDVLRGFGDANGVDGRRDATAFKRQLERCLMEVRRHQLPAGLITFGVSDAPLFAFLVELIRIQSRGLDQIWVSDAETKTAVVCVLLPFTDKDGVFNFCHRLERLVQEKRGQRFSEAGITARSRIVTARNTAIELLAEVEQIAQGHPSEIEVWNDRQRLDNVA